MTLSLGINVAHLDANVAQADLGLRNVGGPAAGTAAAAVAVDSAYGNDGDIVGDGELLVGAGGEAITYATEIFGSNSASTILPSGTAHYAGAVYNFDGEITVKFNATFKLSNGAVFSGDPVVYLNYDTGLETSPTKASGGDGKSFVTYTVDPDSNAIGADPDTDSIGIFYKIKSATALASSGQKIEMTAEMATPEPSYPVNPSSTITVAESKQAIKVEITPDTDTDDRISVASGNTEFTAALASDRARIGGISIISDITASDLDANGATPAEYYKPVQPDGFSQWDLATVTVDNTKTALTITEGQFRASVTSPGKVDLTVSSAATVGAGSSVEYAQATDESTAVFELDNDAFGNIQSAIYGSDKPLDILIVADGKTDINVIENPPVAELTIVYSEESYQSITYPAVELKKIKQDGTRCTVYNVPTPGSADIFAVRITNDSGVDGTVNATLYGGDGVEVFSQQPLNAGDAIKAGATLAVFGADLAALGSWGGRGVLVLTTTLPSLEVLGLLRQANDNAAPLTNLSTGATGESCVK
jgi:hypothetical protein